MVWGAIIGAAATIGSGLLAGRASAQGAEKQNREARLAAKTQMDFQERMSNTQYQRGMADMRLAGLNPILAYRQGGAGTPGGSSYSPVNVGASGVTGAVAGAASAVSARKAELERNLNAATLGNIHEDTNKKFSEQRLNQTIRNRGEQEIRNMKINSEILREELQIRKAGAASARAEEKFYNSEAGKVARQIDLWGRSVNPFSGAARNLRR